MAIVQCENKHYYDNEKFSSCPHCSKLEEGGAKPVPKALEAQQVGNYATEYVRKSSSGTSVRQESPQQAGESLSETNCRRYPAGWLVCVQGEEYGMDFPVYAGFNRIGRDGANDIVLSDKEVSREEHCSVIYEEKKNVFYIFPKAGNLTYVGETLVEQAQEIEGGQIIGIGDTQLEFVAFCAGEKRWIKN